jgi:hypothetical protein
LVLLRLNLVFYGVMYDKKVVGVFVFSAPSTFKF